MHPADMEKYNITQADVEAYEAAKAAKAAKPVVTFGGIISVGRRLRADVESAELADVKGHPRLGDQPYVLTTGIINRRYSNDTPMRLNDLGEIVTPPMWDHSDIVEIETKNTVYKRREASA